MPEVVHKLYISADLGVAIHGSLQLTGVEVEDTEVLVAAAGGQEGAGGVEADPLEVAVVSQGALHLLLFPLAILDGVHPAHRHIEGH